MRFNRIVIAMSAVVLAAMAMVFAVQRTESAGMWRVDIQYSDRAPVQVDTSAQTRPDSLREGEVIDLNTAAQADLERLPGIGAERAEAILAFRRERGGFSAVEQLMKVPGIGSGIFRQISPYVAVN